MLDPAIDHKARASAQAIAENNLEAAISSAEARIELETMFIEAARREIKVRGELFRILEADDIAADKVNLYEYSQARMRAESIVEADEILAMAQARITAASSPNPE